MNIFLTIAGIIVFIGGGIFKNKWAITGGIALIVLGAFL